MRRTNFLTTLALASACITSSASAESLDTIPIWSAVLEITTCDVSNAGTDDQVWLRFGESILPLNLGHDERSRAEVDTYELVGMLPSLTGTVFPDRPVLEKIGTDMWCVARVELFVNGAFTPVYSWRGTQKIDQSSGLNTRFALPSLRTSSSGSTFTATSRWGNASAIGGVRTAPTLLDDTFLWRLMDTMEGAILQGDADLRWGHLDGSSYVTVAGRSGGITVDFDLENYAQWWIGGGIVGGGILAGWREADVDIGFELGCSGTDFDARRTSTTCGVNVLEDWADHDCELDATPHGDRLANALDRSLRAVRALGRPCGSFSFSPDGDISLF